MTEYFIRGESDHSLKILDFTVYYSEDDDVVIQTAADLGNLGHFSHYTLLYIHPRGLVHFFAYIKNLGMNSG